MDIDQDLYLGCGCIVAINHGNIDLELSSIDGCQLLHSFQQAAELALSS